MGLPGTVLTMALSITGLAKELLIAGTIGGGGPGLLLGEGLVRTFLSTGLPRDLIVLDRPPGSVLILSAFLVRSLELHQGVGEERHRLYGGVVEVDLGYHRSAGSPLNDAPVWPSRVAPGWTLAGGCPPWDGLKPAPPAP